VRKVVVAEFLSLDGVMEAPEKWSFQFWNDEIAKFKRDELFASNAHLLGRVTYQIFAGAWPSRVREMCPVKSRTMGTQGTPSIGSFENNLGESWRPLCEVIV